MNKSPRVLLHNNSRLRRAAKKAGIEIDRPLPHLPQVEQEETDIM